MREIRSSGLEGGVEFDPPSLPLFYSCQRPLVILKLRRRGMFIRRFMESLVSLPRMHWDLEPRLSQNPKGIPQQSPGLPSLRGYPGYQASGLSQP